MDIHCLMHKIIHYYGMQMRNAETIEVVYSRIKNMINNLCRHCPPIYYTVPIQQVVSGTHPIFNVYNGPQIGVLWTQGFGLFPLKLS